MTLAMLLAALTLSGVTQQQPEFVPEFKLPCHPVEPVKEAPPNAPSKEPLVGGPWYANEDRSLWAAWPPLVSGNAANIVLWMKPPGQAIDVTGRRIDGEGRPFKVRSRAAYLEQGFEPGRLYFSAPGCWEVTATSDGKEWTFVVEVQAP
jgi:hypothetical protein